jgi:hypothetical protein
VAGTNWDVEACHAARVHNPRRFAGGRPTAKGDRVAYSISPDTERPSHLDPEAGGDNSPVSKRSGYRPVDEFDDRALDRSSARDLDRMVEAGEFTRARKDLERAFPRPVVTQVNERKRRTLPIPDAIRLPLSSRQRKARSVAKNATQTALPRIGYKAVEALISDPTTWKTTGAALTAARGDAQGLDEHTRSQVQRIDRAIQTAERGNDRGHVVYCAVSVPHSLPEQSANLPRALQPGSRIEFDRFTMSTHTIHELDPVVGDREVIFEMETARGMYLGGSDSVDDTSHLLPRGMRWQVVSSHEGRYQRPDGSFGRRNIIQLRDITEEN